MSLKLEFVKRATARGVKLAPLCREYGISRVTGHKWLKRFREQGPDGLEERSRRPNSTPLATAEELVLAILEAREAHPRWGPKKLVVVLQRKFGDQAPSRTTIARVLKRFGAISARRKRRTLSVVERAPEVTARAPNDVWTVDFKGWWRTTDGARVEPLTVRDGYSRYVLLIEVMGSTSMDGVRRAFERLFRKHGVPRVIQCDNGVPFISTRARGGLTRLSAWWLSLGIQLARSRPGCPQDNGGHERMHRDVKIEVQQAREESPHAAQRALDRWRQEFNHVRPHEALGGKVPADLYRASPDRAPVPQRYAYPTSWITRKVYARFGAISVDGETYAVGAALTGYTVALEPIDGLKHRLWFGGTDLGEIELAPSSADVERALSRSTERKSQTTRPRKKAA